MSTIHKYVLAIESSVTVEMPIGAKILHVAAQRDELCLWAEVDPDKKLKPRHFEVNGTGHVLNDPPGKYLGTAWFHNGRLVVHVYEVAK